MSRTNRYEEAEPKDGFSKREGRKDGNPRNKRRQFSKSERREGKRKRNNYYPLP